jgi:hypothetical protein
MAADNRKLIEVLKAERAFLERGGYHNIAAPSWRPPFIFQDSPTCLNFGDPEHRRPCEECVLMQLVPFEHWSDAAPCRHNPLNDRGDSIESCYHRGTQQEVETVFSIWLSSTIEKLESGKHGDSGTPKHESAASGPSR